eukprot:1467857-Amphidinium_carterae.1
MAELANKARDCGIEHGDARLKHSIIGRGVAQVEHMEDPCLSKPDLHVVEDIAVVVRKSAICHACSYSHDGSRLAATVLLLRGRVATGGSFEILCITPKYAQECRLRPTCRHGQLARVLDASQSSAGKGCGQVTSARIAVPAILRHPKSDRSEPDVLSLLQQAGSSDESSWQHVHDHVSLGELLCER